jgi:hypothetical protein
MNEITRRRFIEAASLAAAAPAVAAAAQARPAAARLADSRNGATQDLPARDLTDAELEAMFRRCSNTGRWGADDELGTLNYITPARRIAAAALVKTGEVVSVARDLTTRASKTNAQPVVHTMAPIDANGPVATDSFSIAPHGMVVTHMDALCHFSWKDQFYNGRKRSDTLTANGAKWGSIYAQRQGIFTRGVLLDVAAARGVRWYNPDEYVTVADFEAAEKRQRVRVGLATRCSSAPAWNAWRRNRASRTSTPGRACTPSAPNGCTTGRCRSMAATASRSCPTRARASRRPST